MSGAQQSESPVAAGLIAEYWTADDSGCHGAAVDELAKTVGTLGGPVLHGFFRVLEKVLSAPMTIWGVW